MHVVYSSLTYNLSLTTSTMSHHKDNVTNIYWEALCFFIKLMPISPLTVLRSFEHMPVGNHTLLICSYWLNYTDKLTVNQLFVYKKTSKWECECCLGYIKYNI